MAGRAELPSWRVSWIGQGERDGETIVSCVTYPEELARKRAETLRDAGYQGIEVFQVKPGTYERLGS